MSVEELHEQTLEDKAVDAPREAVDVSATNKSGEAEPPEDEEDMAFMTWFEETTKGNTEDEEDMDFIDIVDFDSIPSFNVPFADLISQVTRSPIEFTEMLRTEALIYSYEKFVSRLGDTPSYIFGVFGITLIEKYPLPFTYILGCSLNIYVRTL
jgi:hypothetical protein